MDTPSGLNNDTSYNELIQKLYARIEKLQALSDKTLEDTDKNFTSISNADTPLIAFSSGSFTPAALIRSLLKRFLTAVKMMLFPHNTYYRIIKDSPLFDAEYYQRNYKLKPDADPVRHFLIFGWRKGYNPSRDFSTYAYLCKYPDVAQAGINPLVHYEVFGRNEGRLCKPEVSLHVPPHRRTIESRAGSLPVSGQKTRLSEEDMIAKLSSYDVVSFDIFDTLVLRCVDNPSDVFRILGMLTGIQSFKSLRLKAEQDARQIHGAVNVTIYDIYEIFAKYHHIPSVEEMVQMELSVEKKVCYANPYMKRVYDALLKQGKTIVINSDMYIPEKLMQELLSSCGYSGYSRLCVSCDYKAEKADGRLQQFSVKGLPDNLRIIHVGDNAQSDYFGSRSIHWDAYLYESCRAFADELKLPKKNTLIHSIYSAIVCNHLYNGAEVYTKEYEHGFLYGGILVASFCQWLNRLADEKHYDQIWFLARDMEVVHKAYNQYFRKYNNKYVVSSRSAAMELTFHTNTEKFLDLYFLSRANSGKCTIEDALREADLDLLLPFLKKYRLRKNDILNSHNYPSIRKLIYDSKPIITDYYRQARSGAKQYFDALLETDSSVCLADIGWGATIPLQLREFFHEVYGNKVHVECALMGSTSVESVNDLLSSGFIHSFLFSGSHNTACSMDFTDEDGITQIILMECLFTSSAPTLLKYSCHEDGSAKLVYGHRTESAHTVHEIQQGILDFCRLYSRFVNQFPDFPEVTGADALEPYLGIMNDFDYFYLIFSEAREYMDTFPRLIEGKNLTTIGKIMEERNMV